MPTLSSISQAFVLGAGLGTRLKTLTLRRPKPLIPVAGRPLIAHAFDQLLQAGVRRLVVNTHHCAPVYRRFFPNGQYENAHGTASLEFRHEPELLETGGGIKNVEDLLGAAPFFVYNGDILTTLPLQPAVDYHFAHGNEVTLILRSGGGRLDIAFDPATGTIPDIGFRLGRVPNSHVFTGIYLVNPSFFRRLKREKISVIPSFLAMVAEGSLGGVVVDEGDWWELGTREKYLGACQDLRSADPTASWIDPTAEVHPSARLTGATFVGAGAKIGAQAHLHDCVLWEGAHIAPESSLTRCIVTDGQTACGTHADEDF